MDTKSVIARFEAERQALAVMDHPNIAKVLDAGTTDQGRPYFVMELVRGIEITRYCDQQKLTVPERVGLFTTVCQAIQHAHQKGIIHRDIKPSNVLVTEQDGRAIPKVIDFGVAKAIGTSLTDRTVYTNFQAIIGTPMYMSPEQAALSNVDVDTRSDVYSLGVLLYELLTGTTPFDKETLKNAAQDEVFRMIRQQDPPKPSTKISTLGDQANSVSQGRRTDLAGLGRTVRGDLDWIVMKAMAKDRSRRYESASQLAQDIDRHLQGDAVQAGPDSLVYRLRKAARKHRVALAVSAVILLTLAAGIATSLLFAWRSHRIAGELRETLDRLQTEIVDHAFRLALTGDITEVEEALTRAEQAGAARDLIATIRGVAHVHSDIDRASALLGQALEDNPDNVTALCALTWANLFAGRYAETTLCQHRLASMPKQELNDYGRLLLAQTKVYGVLEPQRLISEMDRLIADHSQWGMAYAVRAEARHQVGQMTKERDAFFKATEDAEEARRLLPDSPYVLAAAMASYNYAIQWARHQGLDTADLEQKADAVANELGQWPKFLDGRMRRSLYYKLIGEDEKFQAENQDLLDRKMGWPQPYLAELLRRDDPTALIEFAKEHPDIAEPTVAVAIRHVIDGNETQALHLLKELELQHAAPGFRMGILDILCLAGRREEARQLAKRTLESVADYDTPDVWRWDFFMIKYVAEEFDEQEFLEMAGPFHWERCAAHFSIGLDALAAGDKEKARRHLEISQGCAAPGWWLTIFSNVYLDLMEQGRLSVQPGKRTTID